MKKDYHGFANRVFVTKYHPKDFMHLDFNKFIKENLFEEKTPLHVGNSDITREDSCFFDTTIRINLKEYRINPAVLKEMFLTMNFVVEDAYSLENQEYIVIENNIDARYTNPEKIEYLKDKRKELYLTVQNESEFYLYAGKGKIEDYDNWEDYIYSFFNSEFIIQYLTEGIYFSNFPKFLFEQWHRYYKTNMLVEYCENKINELLEEKEDSSIKKIDLSFQLALLEKIMKLENWDDISANKKGLILTNLLGKNKDNIKDYYNESIKKVSDLKSKFYDKSGKYETDKSKAIKLLNEILG